MGLTYIYHKSIALFLRGLVRHRLDLHPTPDETISIPSRDTGRMIKAHVYKPVGENRKTPSPVLINFCGSGFVLRTFGSDDEYCHFIAANTDYTVIDVQYRLAPESPFPAAFNDAEDTVTWVRSQPEQFDISCVSLSGFSAGANIALAVSCSPSLFSSKDDSNVFRTVMSFYGPVDMSVPTPEKPLADRSNFIMRKIFPTFSHLCHKCLDFGKVDPRDLRLSPLFAEPSSFPPNVLIITAAQCSFAIEAEKLAENIGNVDGKHVICERMHGCAHGWDKEAIRGTPQCEAKDKAYEMAARMLRKRGDEVEKPQDRWDHNTTGDSRKQWERLIWDWESLTLVERYLYHQRAQSESAPSELSEEIKRVLSTHQTAHEPNISLVSCDSCQTIWLRTCHDPGLAEKYEQMMWESEVPGWGVSGEDKILEDPSRYDFDDGSRDSWRRVLICMPGITEFRGVFDMDGDGSNIQYISGQDDEEMVVRCKEVEERWRDLSLAQLRIQVGLYLLDRGAIESGLIKILWLDEHGQIAWETRLDPFTSALSRLTGCLLNATSLVELAGYDGTRGALIEN